MRHWLFVSDVLGHHCGFIFSGHKDFITIEDKATVFSQNVSILIVCDAASYPWMYYTSIVSMLQSPSREVEEK
jgi:hypothetical protein